MERIYRCQGSTKLMARVRLSGLDKLNRRLYKLPIEAEKHIRVAMEKGAQEIVDLAKSLAPLGKSTGVKSSNNPGALRDSIGWVWGSKAPKGSVSLGQVKGAGGVGRNDLTITIYAGNDKVFYARWVEFGTKPHGIDAKNAPTMGRAGVNFGKHVDHPGASSSNAFFFPAYRALRKRSKDRITRAIRSSIRSTINST